MKRRDFVRTAAGLLVPAALPAAPLAIIGSPTRLRVSGGGESAPVNTVPPSVTGTPTEGQTISCSTGTWTNSPTSYAYQWLRDGSPISGANSSTHTLASADVGEMISCEVTATNAAGSAAAESSDVGPVQEAGEPGSFLFHDDFASGDLGHTQNGVSWIGSRNTLVVEDAGSSSGRALRFRYGSPSPGSWAEQRFGLGDVYTELWLRLLLVIPANYSHTDGPTSDNNKILRIWSGDTSDGNGGYSSFYVKNGAEIRPFANDSGQSFIYHSFGTNTSAVGPYGSPSADWIVDSDYGEEVEWIFRFKVDDAGTPGGTSSATSGGNGVSQFWKNRQLMLSTTSAKNRPSTGTNGYNMGYLLGASNSDYNQGEQVTDFLLREFTVSQSDIWGVL